MKYIYLDIEIVVIHASDFGATCIETLFQSETKTGMFHLVDFGKLLYY